MAAVISGMQVECTFNIKPNFKKSLTQYFTNLAICSVKAWLQSIPYVHNEAHEFIGTGRLDSQL
jgi:hypothetical protein